MILGIGVDLVEISRAEEMLQKPHFCARCFTEAERAYFAARGKTAAQSAAAAFAAKEAVLKALGTGLSGAPLADIEVKHLKSGAPLLVLHGKALERASAHGPHHMLLSLSHEAGMAVAMVVWESGENE